MRIQGMRLQGMRLQGLRLQGVSLQGINIQGVRLQGIRLQGLSVQGISVQGSSLSGVVGGGELSAEELVAFALETFGDGLVLATSFGPQTILLMDWIAKLRPQTEVFYLDTGLLFEETHALRRELEQRLGIRTKPVTPLLSLEEQAETFGPELWSRDPEPPSR